MVGNADGEASNYSFTFHYGSILILAQSYITVSFMHLHSTMVLF